MRFIKYSTLIALSVTLYAQSSQGEYLEAKRQFSLGNYKVAKQTFQSLTNDPTFGVYASFYYALSALKNNEPGVAEDMWKQIKIKHPSWEKQNEVDFWLAYVAFDQGNYSDAFERSDKLPIDVKDPLIDSFLRKLSIEGLDSAYILNPDNKYVAEYLIKAMNDQPYGERDRIKMIEIAEKHDLSISSNVELPIIKKDKYVIAVVMPFMFEALETPQTVIRNSIIFDLYQGMELANEKLAEGGIALELFPFDTKKKSDVTYNYIKEGKFDDADVIVGPLYSGPSRFVREFSKENKISMINPLSSNSETIGDNPYSLLFKPSYETQGKEAAKFAVEKFKDNKKLFIFYETDRDSLVAQSYLKEMEKDSFFVIRFDRLTNEDAQQIQKDFTEEYEVRIDTMFSTTEIDSISEIPGRIVRTRSLRDARGRLIKDQDGNEVPEYYEVKFNIQPDSIGHIFVASSSNLLANNFISLAEVRSDSIGIIGYEDWLNFSTISYNQLERIQVDFVSPSYVDRESFSYSSLKKNFIEKYGTLPSEYHIQGYELILHIGRLLNEHGKYFQRGFLNNQYNPGYIMSGLKYGPYNDNQVVPITTIRNLELVNQNLPSEVERE